MRISVVIPVWRDWPRLALCLDALARQTLPAADFEVIVVDNDDTHAPPPMPAGVRCLHEPRGYSYAARNAGLAVTRGEVIAFTDADCIPDPDWLEQGLAALAAHPEWGLAAGRIELFGERDNAVLRFEQLFEFQQRHYVENLGFGATANLFARRAVVEATGGFDASMKSGGDSDFGRRARMQGYAVGYADGPTIRHPSRATLAAVLQKNRRIAAGFYGHALRDNGGRREGLWRRLHWWWRPRPREWWLILRGGRGSERYPLRQRWGVLALHALLHYHTAWCLLSTHLTEGRSHRGYR